MVPLVYSIALPIFVLLALVFPTGQETRRKAVLSWCIWAGVNTALVLIAGHFGIVAGWWQYDEFKLTAVFCLLVSLAIAITRPTMKEFERERPQMAASPEQANSPQVVQPLKKLDEVV